VILTIWRHGEAGSAPTDRQRQLTDRGMDDIGFGCQQLYDALQVRNIPAPGLILYSPWVRTAETAKIIGSAFSHATSSELDSLRPDSTVLAIETSLAECAGDPSSPAHVVLVSHQPLVSRLAGHLLGAGHGVPSLSPGALVTLSLDVVAADCAQLLFWAVPPEYELGL